MSRKIEVTLYTFDELTDKAKERAREWWRKCLEGETFYAEPPQEDLTELLVAVGFDESTLQFGWSGFWSQGDGAHFTGQWTAQRFAFPDETGLDRLHPLDEQLTRIVEEFRSYARLEPNAACTIKHRGSYSHEGCTQFEMDNEHSAEFENDFTDTCRELMRWFYSELEKSYEWHNADEQVDNNILANEYEFTENGAIA